MGEMAEYYALYDPTTDPEDTEVPELFTLAARAWSGEAGPLIPCSLLPTPPRQKARPAKWEQGTWVTREGQKLRISEMGDGHLVNTLHMLKRKGYVGWRALSDYLRGPRPNGEIAQGAFDREADEAFSRPYHPALDDLEDEARRRGLRS